MAPAVGPGQTAPAQWSLFKPGSWGKGARKIKVAHLPQEESNMYFHPELKRWVERGKENEAAADPGNAPPPTIAALSSTVAQALTPPPSGPSSTGAARKPVSSRYVLQNNLSVSSSASDLTDTGRTSSVPNLLPSGTSPSPRDSQSGAPTPKAFFLPAPASATSGTTATAAEDTMQPSAAAQSPDPGFNFFRPGSADADQPPMKSRAKSTNAWAGYSQAAKPAQARRSSNLGNASAPAASPPAADPSPEPDMQNSWAQDAAGGPPLSPAASGPCDVATPDDTLPQPNGSMHADPTYATAATTHDADYPPSSEWHLPHAHAHAAAAPGFPVPPPAAWQQQQQQLPSPLDSTDASPSLANMPHPPMQEVASFKFPAAAPAPLNGALETRYSHDAWAPQQPAPPISTYAVTAPATPLPKAPAAGTAAGTAADAPADDGSRSSPSLLTPPPSDRSAALPLQQALPSRGAPTATDAPVARSNAHTHGNGDTHEPANGGGLHGTAKGLHTKGRQLLGALAGYVAQQVSSLDSDHGVSGADAWGFEAAMHPGTTSKLDGPLPWELPEQLRYSDSFLSICTAWQRNNPGKLYSPDLLLPRSEEPGDAAVEAGAAAEQAAVAAAAAAESPEDAWRKGYALRKLQEQEHEQGQLASLEGAAASGAVSLPASRGISGDDRSQQQPLHQQQQHEAVACNQQGDLALSQQGYSPDALAWTSGSDPASGAQSVPSVQTGVPSSSSNTCSSALMSEAGPLGCVDAAGRGGESGPPVTQDGGAAAGSQPWGQPQQEPHSLWQQQQQQMPWEQEQQQQQQQMPWQPEQEQQQQMLWEPEQQQQQQQPWQPEQQQQQMPWQPEPEQQQQQQLPWQPDQEQQQQQVVHALLGVSEQEAGHAPGHDGGCSALAAPDGPWVQHSSPLAAEDGTSFFSEGFAGDGAVARGEAGHASSFFFSEGAGAVGVDAAAAAGDDDDCAFFVAAGAAEQVPTPSVAAHAASWGGDHASPAAAAAGAAEAYPGAGCIAHGDHMHELLQEPAHEVDWVVSDLVSSLEPQADGTAAADGWMHDGGVPGPVADADPGASDSSRAAAALLTQLLHGAQAQPGPVPEEELGRALELVAAALGHPGAAAARHASPPKADGDAPLLTPPRAPAAPAFAAEPSPDPSPVPASEQGPSLSSDCPRPHHHTPDYHAMGKGDRVAGAEPGAVPNAGSAEAAMRSEIQGEYDVRLAGRTSDLEAQLQAQLVACAEQLEVKFESQLAARAALLEAKFEAEVAARASLLEVKVEAEVRSLRAALRAEHEAEVAGKDAAMAGKDAALEEARRRCEELQEEQDQLLLCLGQESRKVADLSQAMQDAGLDVDAIIGPIEEEYAMMDELPQDE